MGARVGAVMVLGAALVAGVAGCGRFGFGDDRPATDAPVTQADARIDGPAVDVDAPIDANIGDFCASDSVCGRCARCEASVCQAEPVNAVYLGHRSLCYLGLNGARWCAGENSAGDLGLGEIGGVHASPERTAGEDTWTQLGLMYQESYGIRGDRIYHWGAGNPTPTDVGSAATIAVIHTDNQQSCIERSDGTFDCDPSGTVWQVFELGSDHQCGIKTDGTLWCWGLDQAGSLGQGVLPPGTTLTDPTQVGGDTDWATVAGGEQMTCAIKTTGALYCWGAADLTGTNGIDTLGIPTQIGAALTWQWVQADYRHTCARKTNGSVWCWGNDTQGGLVVPGASNVPVPTQVGLFEAWVMGGHHACGRNGEIWECFGWNAAGQLGIGNTDPQPGFVSLCPAAG